MNLRKKFSRCSVLRNVDWPQCMATQLALKLKRRSKASGKDRSIVSECLVKTVWLKPLWQCVKWMKIVLINCPTWGILMRSMALKAICLLFGSWFLKKPALVEQLYSFSYLATCLVGRLTSKFESNNGSNKGGYRDSETAIWESFFCKRVEVF